jgi:hypothetical protein
MSSNTRFDNNSPNGGYLSYRLHFVIKNHDSFFRSTHPFSRTIRNSSKINLSSKVKWNLMLSKASQHFWETLNRTHGNDLCWGEREKP